MAKTLFSVEIGFRVDACLNLAFMFVAAGPVVGGNEFFQPYLGSVVPLAAVALAIAAGSICLRLLDLRGWFKIYKRGKCSKALIVSISLAMLLAIPVIVVDFAISIEVNNVPPRWSLLCYQAVAFIVEAFLRTLPGHSSNG